MTHKPRPPREYEHPEPLEVDELDPAELRIIEALARGQAARDYAALLEVTHDGRR